jgi:hypothetical protein
MLQFLRGKASDRKLRLFAVACCRRIWKGLGHERSRDAVEVAERFADGKAGPAELLTAHDFAYAAVDECVNSPLVSEDHALAACGSASEEAMTAAWDAVSYAWDGSVEQTTEFHAGLLREILGNPFHPVTFDSSWLTPTGLADRIYQERIFDRMPVLADALEDAGCTNQDILAHCRQPGEHCRGCRVVDLLLGME